MFSDPTVITINAVAKNVIRINQDGYSSEYLLKETLGEYRLRIRHSTYTDKVRSKKVDRHNVELVHTVYPVAPATVSTVRKTYVVLENDVGDDATATQQFATGLLAFLTGANVTKLLNWES
jgi:hypothetical protein